MRYRYPEPLPPPLQPPAPPKPKVRQRLERLLRAGRLLGPVVGGMLFTLLILGAYSALNPPPAPLNTTDVQGIIAQAMASATPPPPLGAMIYAAVRPSVVTVMTRVLTTDGKREGGRGTGVVIDDNGTILTSWHVVADAIEIQVVFFDGSESEASVVNKDTAQDLAALRPKVIPDNLTPAMLGNSNALNVGEEAFVIGNPFGITGSFTAGVISGKNRTFKPPKAQEPLKGLIQFDAAVNPGNSGGPLVNRAGEVVGIVTGLVNPTDQDVFIGIGFAVPIQAAGGAIGSPPY
ncbi:MAG: trypsin-like peptidase domain-containing protein [Chloroflexi bacterium]|nr:trypsin-like peptidase domain-containing protein [Chloroflexota bacterium]